MASEQINALELEIKINDIKSKDLTSGKIIFPESESDQKTPEISEEN